MRAPSFRKNGVRTAGLFGRYTLFLGALVTILLLILHALPVFADNPYSSDDRYVTVEDFSHPAADALKAFGQEDFKFIALGGGPVPQIPGVDLEMAKKNGYRIMSGTQDALKSGEKRPSRPQAALYAQEFNRELSMYILLKKKI